MSGEGKFTSYRDAGVDIDGGARLVERIKSIARTTRRDGVVSGIGGFGALFELPEGRYRHPLLVSGTDGVGTKLKLAERLRRHDTIGIDLVAMCVNDVLTLGAEPLFFLDYYATGRLDEERAAEVLAGIGEGCRQAGAALIGGETAEMPGMYPNGEYDLAGFCVGVVEKARVIDGAAVRPGDRLLGIASSGPHSNGYSLIRKIIADTGADLEAPLDGASLGESLLRPTRIYAAAIRALLDEVGVHAIAHITGGGLTDNLPRVLPPGVRASVRTASWPRPAVFEWIARAGHLPDSEMYRTFNCGIGMVLVVAPGDCEAALEILAAQGERAWQIGNIEACPQDAAGLVLV